MGRNRAAADALFTKTDYETLVKVERQLNDMITTLDKAELCGVNCAVWRQQRQDLATQLAAIKQHFMTPPPG